jgi:uncharacterized protein (TIRG00374 family)
MMKHPVTRYVIAGLIAAVALYFAFRHTDFHALTYEFGKANIAVILAGTLVMFSSHLVRAWRYKMFLRPIAPNTRVSSAFRALIAGYAMNNLIPRSGDIVRPVIFSKREGIPIASAVAVLLIERLTDLIGLSAILIFVLLYFAPEIANGFPAISSMTLPLILVLSAIFVAAVLILFSEKKTQRVIDILTRKLPEKVRLPIEHAAANIEAGLRGVRQGSAVPVVLGTLGISALYTLSMFVATFAFPDDHLRAIGFIGCFLLQTMSGLAFTIPTPGGTGTYHFFISQSLADVFGVPTDVAVAFATLTHASNYILTTVIGLGFMIADGVSITSVQSEELKAEVKIARQSSREVSGTDDPGQFAQAGSTNSISQRLNAKNRVGPVPTANRLEPRPGRSPS